MNKILLIDGHSILNRAFYGVPMLTAPGGRHTNAVYGFLSIMFKAIEEEQPDHLAVAFDLSVPTFRHKIYQEYKGTRKPMPAELHEQVSLMREILDAMQIPVVTLAGFEADDLIGTLAKKAEAEGNRAVILSGDRDLLQLVSDSVVLRLPHTSKGNTVEEIFTPEHVKEVYGITPEQIVDLKAMMGDSSDNIPGLPGIGEKTALGILSAYGSLDEAYRHKEEIKPPRASKAFTEHFDLAELSRTLATIDTQVPYKEEIPKLGNIYTDAAKALFASLELKKFLYRFENTNQAAKTKKEIVKITGLSETEAFIEEVIKEGECGFSLAIDGKKLLGAAVATAEKEAYIPCEGFVTEDYLKEKLRLIYQNCASVSTIDLKSQLSFLEPVIEREVFDLRVMAYLLDPLRSSYTADYIAGEYLESPLPSIEEIVGEKITKKTVLSECQIATLQTGNARCAFDAKKILKEKLQQTGMWELYTNVEQPLIFTLYEMEKLGICLNTQALKEFSGKLDEMILAEQKTIYERVGEEFNIQSPKQLGTILFEKMKLPGGKKTKSGYSTAADVLEKLAEEEPVVRHILTYRQLTKLKSTYADALVEYVEEDGRVHTVFNQTVTATGRLSSQDPNLQNIPVRMELGQEIRRVFEPKPGCVFVDADYSQIELRLLGHMSGDEKLIEAYGKADDIHAITASQVFHVPMEEVTPQMRRNAKAVNFGIIYGISSFGLSQGLNIDRKTAAEYIQNYFNTYPGIKSYLDGCVSKAKDNGWTDTMFGRRRPIPELKASNFMVRSFGERAAMNAPIQGTAADIIKIAMNRVRDRLRKENMQAVLILQVHDELLVEAPKEEAQKAAAILKEEMENAAKLRVKLEVEVKCGSNWLEAH